MFNNKILFSQQKGLTFFWQWMLLPGFLGHSTSKRAEGKALSVGDDSLAGFGRVILSTSLSYEWLWSALSNVHQICRALSKPYIVANMRIIPRYVFVVEKMLLRSP